MKQTIAHIFLFLAAFTMALGQPTVPVSNLSPLNSGTVVGRTDSGTGRAQTLTAGPGITIANGTISSSGGASAAPAAATYILRTANATLTNAQVLSSLSSGVVTVTTGTGVLASTAPGLAGNVLTSNGTGWASTIPAYTGNVTAAGTLDSGNIVIGQGAKTIATSSVFSISGSNATVTGNLAVTGGMSLNNLTTSNFTVTGNITATGVGNGTLLIGNTTGTKFNVATLTAGDGVSITNGAGTITINATGTGGTVTANATLTSGRVVLGGGGNIIGPNSAATNGQLLIGNTTNGNMQLSTITAGDNIAITNSAGGITINATGFGTGNVTGSGLTANAIVVGGGASAISIGAAPGTFGNVLTSDGTQWTSAAAAAGNVTKSGTPTSGQLASWTSATNIQGITSANVTQGGTGLGTLTANNIITGNGTGNVTFIAPGTTGNVVTSNGTAFNSSAPTWFGSAIVSGCTTVTANSTGNLTFASANANLTITTDNTTKTVTLNATGGGGGSGTVSSATAGQISFYAATGTTVSGNGNLTFTNPSTTPTLGLNIPTGASGSYNLLYNASLTGGFFTGQAGTFPSSSAGDIGIYGNSKNIFLTPDGGSAAWKFDTSNTLSHSSGTLVFTSNTRVNGTAAASIVNSGTSSNASHQLYYNGSLVGGWFTGQAATVTAGFSAGDIGLYTAGKKVWVSVDSGSTAAVEIDTTGYTFLKGQRGTATNDSAAAGNVGQVISSLIAPGSAVSLSNATTTNITSISLTAGDWICAGGVTFHETTATVTERLAGITGSSASISLDGTEVYSGSQTVVTTCKNSATISFQRVSLSGTTTIYLAAKPTFSAGTVTGSGSIKAVRIR